MRTRPFLSHKREDRRQVIALKRELCLYGTGGWRDLDDLHVGELGSPEFKRVVTQETGGFIWYGTRRAVGSNYINTVELPPAIQRKRDEPHYPLVPLFLNASRNFAKQQMGSALRDEDAETFFDASGLVRGRQRTAEFHREVARKYARSAAASLDQDSFTIAATALSEPDGRQDFTLDWRAALDPVTRELRLDPAVLQDALWNLRDALKPRTEFPELTLDLDLPMPLAMLLGYEWRVTSRLRLTIRQRTRSAILVVSGDGATTPVGAWPGWAEDDYERDGPVVVSLSTRVDSLTVPLARYADELGAGYTYSLHVPGQLDAAGMRGLARYTAAKLGEVGRERGRPHLLLAGPAGLAALIGAGSNANGPVAMPFWNGERYVSPLVVAAL